VNSDILYLVNSHSSSKTFSLQIAEFLLHHNEATGASCIVFICLIIVFFALSVYCMFLQYFDTVGWFFWPVKTVSHITYYTMLAGT